LWIKFSAERSLEGESDALLEERVSVTVLWIILNIPLNGESMFLFQFAAPIGKGLVIPKRLMPGMRFFAVVQVAGRSRPKRYNRFFDGLTWRTIPVMFEKIRQGFPGAAS
jgi:hypothetical protein